MLSHYFGLLMTTCVLVTLCRSESTELSLPEENYVTNLSERVEVIHRLDTETIRVRRNSEKKTNSQTKNIRKNKVKIKKGGNVPKKVLMNHKNKGSKVANNSKKKGSKISQKIVRKVSKNVGKKMSKGGKEEMRKDEGGKILTNRGRQKAINKKSGGAQNKGSKFPKILSKNRKIINGKNKSNKVPKKKGKKKSKKKYRKLKKIVRVPRIRKKKPTGRILIGDDCEFMEFTAARTQGQTTQCVDGSKIVIASRQLLSSSSSFSSSSSSFSSSS